MPRPKRKKIEFTEKSVNDLFQEVYNDQYNIRANIRRLFQKWERFVKEGGEVAAIGDQIIKLITAESKTQDQKLMLLKYLKEIVFDKKSSDDEEEKSASKEISNERKSALLDMVQQGINEKENK